MPRDHQPLAFTKMTGCGNDFILIDNRTGRLEPAGYADLARKICRRRLSVGADGLILIEGDPEVDFHWRFFNCDGSEPDMCGNGARCAVRYAFRQGIGQSRRLSFRTRAGIIRGEILDDGRVKVQVTDPTPLTPCPALTACGRIFACQAIDTGVPHAVVFCDSPQELHAVDVERWGRALREHPLFQPAGTNVDFVAILDGPALAVRTYERGVEQETLACGTGAIAAALAAARRHGLAAPITVVTQSGERLTVHFQDGGDAFSDVFLEGEARVVYDGQLGEEPFGV